MTPFKRPERFKACAIHGECQGLCKGCTGPTPETAMTKAALWKIFTDKNPSFNGTGNVTLSAAGLRKLFDQAYEHGHDQGVEEGKAAKPSLFEQLFPPHHP
jgi:hypothetical protein